MLNCHGCSARIRKKINLYLKETFKAFVNVYLSIINDFFISFLLTFSTPVNTVPSAVPNVTFMVKKYSVIPNYNYYYYFHLQM